MNRPTAPERPSAEARILVVLMGSLGDVARGLCVVSPIKQALPRARLSWVVESRWAPLVQRHPLIDRVFVFARERGAAGALTLWRELRRDSFDVILDLQRILKSGVCAFAAGAPRRIGFHPRDAKEFNHFFNSEYIPFQGEEPAKILHYLKFVEQLGIDAGPPLDFGLGGLEPRQVIAPLLERTGEEYVVLVLGSAWVSKNWTADGYFALARRIMDASRCKVVLCGDRAQSGAARELTLRLDDARVVDLAGGTSLIELCALLKGARAAAGPDSGPGHLAAAVGRPYVSLFGPTAPGRTAPFGSEHLVVKAPCACAPCYRRTCREPDHACMRGIEAEMVWAKLGPLLKED